MRAVGTRGEVEINVLEVLEITDLRTHIIDVQRVPVTDSRRCTAHKLTAVDGARDLGAAQGDGIVLRICTVAADDIAADADSGEVNDVVLRIVACRVSAVDIARDRAARYRDLVGIRLHCGLTLCTVDSTGQSTAFERDAVAAHRARAAAGAAAAARTARRCRIRGIGAVDIADRQRILAVNRERVVRQTARREGIEPRRSEMRQSIRPDTGHKELVPHDIMPQRGDAREYFSIRRRCICGTVGTLTVTQTVECQQGIGPLCRIGVRMHIDLIGIICIVCSEIRRRIVREVHRSVALNEFDGVRAHPCRIECEFRRIDRDVVPVHCAAETARLSDLEHGPVDEAVVVKNKFEGVEVFHLLHGDIARLYDQGIARSGSVVAAVELARDGCTVGAVICAEGQRIARCLSCGRSIARVDIARDRTARNVGLVGRDRARSCRVAAVERSNRTARHAQNVVLNGIGVRRTADIAAIARCHLIGVRARRLDLEDVAPRAARTARRTEGLGTVRRNAATELSVDREDVVLGRMPAAREPRKPVRFRACRIVRRNAVLEAVVLHEYLPPLCSIRIRAQDILVVAVRRRCRCRARRVVVGELKRIRMRAVNERDFPRDLP